ncbi:HNH endonuclease [Soonwooa buanensis]|uniref:HNH endonuclease n=1 Tax=Soonwooa buanensis TaxID=619805 RepID=A0A1T5CVB8_9FLAO|nr:HNH endonuclease signature motif containing protein [Soonwooa buanensis]SKB63293.1 HNH endonuclease [Soonwooa buanensis]
MKKNDLKRHLSIYSIFKKRNTTINHAFASAISYYDDYDESLINKALKFLNQNPNNDLKCVYCNKKGETWDHLEALVNSGTFTGFGHELGNLVPCCKKCNSSKGRKNYVNYITGLKIEESEKENLISKLTDYKNTFIANKIDINSKEYNKLTQKYYAIKNEIFELMKQADIEAEIIRNKLKK